MSPRMQRGRQARRRDRSLSFGYSIENLAKIAHFGIKGGPRRMLREINRYPWIKTLLEVNKLHDFFTSGRSGRYREANAFLITNFTSSIIELLESIIHHPDKVVLHEDMVPSEILSAMGLKPWMAEFAAILLSTLDSSVVENYIDVAESTGVPPDMCSLPKSTMGMVLDGKMPLPKAIVASNMPCDGGMIQYSVIQKKHDVPLFCLDVPFNFKTARAVEYFVTELKKLIQWLEMNTGHKMDWDRMREICMERNKMMELEIELWDLVSHKPAPMAAEPVYLSHLLYGIAQPGTKRGTHVFRRLVKLARKNFKEGKGAVENEQNRVVLWNPPTMLAIDLFAWAEKAYGVALVMDMLTYHRHPFIDIRTPDTILNSLAQVIMNGPMAQHTRGPVENFLGDLFRAVTQFQADMIWMAGHIGCKNTQAVLGILREQCREREIPLLVIDYDLTDSRVVSPSDIHLQIDQFMETVMRAERLKHQKHANSISNHENWPVK